MSDELLYFEFLENDVATSNMLKRKRCWLREESDPFIYLSETEFSKRYRLDKDTAMDLCEELRPPLKINKKLTDLTVEQKVLTALAFYGTGSYQRPIGDISAHSMAQQTVSTTLAQVTAALNTPGMRRKYIVFPQTPEERNVVKGGFWRKFGIPGVLGAIDGTHIAITRPSDNEERFFNRKHFHSLNVQLICDAEMRITSVDASFGGANHDSFIWNEHPIQTHLETLNEVTWLLGDSAYPLRKYMMTPVLDAAPNTPESYYTDLHIKARNIIERTIGLLKARFRCLLSHRVLHYKPEVAGSIVNACVILHNLCLKANISEPEILLDAHGEANFADVEEDDRALQLGQSTRAALIRRLWADRREV